MKINDEKNGYTFPLQSKKNPPSLEEITREVEIVRSKR